MPRAVTHPRHEGIAPGVVLFGGLPVDRTVIDDA
jgi:hypothetical protein